MSEYSIPSRALEEADFAGLRNLHPDGRGPDLASPSLTPSKHSRHSDPTILRGVSELLLERHAERRDYCGILSPGCLKRGARSWTEDRSFDDISRVDP